MDAINPVVLVPAPAEPWKGPAKGMTWNTRDDVDLVSGGHPFAAVLVGPVGRRVDFGREVMGKEQDAQAVSLDRYAVLYVNSLLVAA
jgi:hypothetical protein